MTTRQEQILIHLYGQMGLGNAYQMPYETTQDGIAEAIGISRGHVVTEIKKLEEKGFVYHLQRHVTASPKRTYAQSGGDHPLYLSVLGPFGRPILNNKDNSQPLLYLQHHHTITKKRRRIAWKEPSE